MIRLANISDIDEIMDIYKISKEIMGGIGNNTQWNNGYPNKEMIIEDIKNKNSYLVYDNDSIVGVFSFIIGEDETYSYIEDGSFLSNSEYGTIHRLGSNGRRSGVFKECVDFCLSKINHIRIDTHKNNTIMRHLIEKYGFIQCGIIYVFDGTKRIAYEFIKED